MKDLLLILLLAAVCFYLYQEYNGGQSAPGPEQAQQQGQSGMQNFSSAQKSVKKGSRAATIKKVPADAGVFAGDKKIVFMTSLKGCPYSAKRRGNLEAAFKNPAVSGNYKKTVVMVGNTVELGCSSADARCISTMKKDQFLLNECGDTFNFCIINPRTQEYMTGSSNDAKKAEAFLAKYATW